MCLWRSFHISLATVSCIMFLRFCLTYARSSWSGLPPGHRTPKFVLHGFHRHDLVCVANDIAVSVAICMWAMFRSEVGWLVALAESHMEFCSAGEVLWTRTSWDCLWWKVGCIRGWRDWCDERWCTEVNLFWTGRNNVDMISLSWLRKEIGDTILYKARS